MKTDMKDALWNDCETDLERADFIRMGRAWQTGIIAHDLQSDVAMAFEFRGQIMADRAKNPPAPDLSSLLARCRPWLERTVIDKKLVLRRKGVSDKYKQEIIVPEIADLDALLSEIAKAEEGR